MNKKDSGFSLIIVVIFMSIAALFIGYLMGSWLISFLVDEDQSQMAQQNNPAVESQNLARTNNQIKEKKVNNSDNKLTAPQNDQEKEKDQMTANKAAEKPVNTNNNVNKDLAVSNSETTAAGTNNNKTGGNEGNGNQKAGEFAVQIGAFTNYSNALALKEKVEKKGYQVLVTESSPHQVQVTGYSTRSKAEAASEELKKDGYPIFIVSYE